MEKFDLGLGVAVFFAALSTGTICLALSLEEARSSIKAGIFALWLMLLAFFILALTYL